MRRVKFVLRRCRQALDHQINEQGSRRFKFGAVEEKEIIVLPQKIGHFAVNDAVRIGDDHALLRLPEDLLEGDDRHTAGHDEVLQQIAGTDGGELVAVPHEDDPAAEPDGTQQM